MKNKNVNTQEEIRKLVRKEARGFEDWENSLEGVLYDLSIWGEPCVEDTKNKVIIAKTLLKLPSRIRRKVLDEIIFVLMSAGGMMERVILQKAIKKEDIKKYMIMLGNNKYYVKIEQPLIFLNFTGRMKESEKMDSIAHEIAHFILRHFEQKKGRSHEKDEKAADDLIEKWGFKRGYKSYSQFRR